MIVDYTGCRFGKLYVVRKAGIYRNERGRAFYVWECRHDNGKTVLVRSDHLKRYISAAQWAARLRML